MKQLNPYLYGNVPDTIKIKVVVNTSGTSINTGLAQLVRAGSIINIL
jgi:hypothetical protein